MLPLHGFLTLQVSNLVNILRTWNHDSIFIIVIVFACKPLEIHVSTLSMLEHCKVPCKIMKINPGFYLFLLSGSRVSFYWECSDLI